MSSGSDSLLDTELHPIYKQIKVRSCKHKKNMNSALLTVLVHYTLVQYSTVNPLLIGSHKYGLAVHRWEEQTIKLFSTDIEQVTSSRAPPAPPISMLLFCHIHFQSWDSTCNFSFGLFLYAKLDSDHAINIEIGGDRQRMPIPQPSRIDYRLFLPGMDRRS